MIVWVVLRGALETVTTNYEYFCKSITPLGHFKMANLNTKIFYKACFILFSYSFATLDRVNEH